MTNLVELSVEDSVAIVRLNRPDVRNAINDEMRAQFVAALDRAGNDEAVRAVVLTGSGKSFCSGGDISGMRDRLQAPSGKVAFNGWRRQQQTHRSVAALHGTQSRGTRPVVSTGVAPAARLPDAMGSLIKKRRKRMRKKKHKKMLKRTRFQRRAAGK